MLKRLLFMLVLFPSITYALEGDIFIVASNATYNDGPLQGRIIIENLFSGDIQGSLQTADEALGAGELDNDYFYVWATTFALIYWFIFRKGYSFIGAMLFMINSLVGAYIVEGALISLTIYISVAVLIIEGIKVLQIQTTN